MKADRNNPVFLSLAGIACWVLVVSFAGACSQRAQVSSDNSDDPESYFGPQQTSAENPVDQNLDGKGGIGAVENGGTSVFHEEEVDGIPKLAESKLGDEAAEIEYPELKFYGLGTLSNNKKIYDTWGKVTVNMNERDLELDLTDLQIVVPNHQDKSDKETRKEKGMSTFWRVQKDEMVRLIKEDDFNNAPYVIFANGAVKPNGKGTFHFDRPLPVFAWPAREAAYQGLKDAGSESWSARVNDDYMVHVTVSYEGFQGDLIKLKIEADIPADREGRIYETFPISKESIFYINTESRRVMKLRTSDRYYDEEKKRGERNDLLWKLCSSSRSGETKKYNCRSSAP